MMLVVAWPLDLREERSQPSSSTACKGVGEWRAIHQILRYGHVHTNGCVDVKA